MLVTVTKLNVFLIWLQNYFLIESQMKSLFLFRDTFLAYCMHLLLELIYQNLNSQINYFYCLRKNLTPLHVRLKAI